MIYYDRTNVSERIDVNKTSISIVCDVCHYWYFLNLTEKSGTLKKISNLFS